MRQKLVFMFSPSVVPGTKTPENNNPIIYTFTSIPDRKPDDLDVLCVIRPGPACPNGKYIKNLP